MTYQRKLSATDKTFLAQLEGKGLEHPIQRINQFVVEGEGQLDVTAFEKAVAQVAEAYPGLRVIQKGVLGTAKWVAEGPVPPVTLIPDHGWDGTHSDTPFHNRILDPVTGPTSEIVLLPGVPARIVFRTHHAVMDGHGTKVFIREVFKALRGEPLDSDRTTLTELDIYQNTELPALEGGLKPTRSCLSFDGKADGYGFGFTWKRKRLDGKYRNSTAMALYEMARIMRSNSPEPGDVRFKLSINLRRHTDTPDIVGNFTNFVTVEVAENDRELDVRKNLLKIIKQKRELRYGSPALLNIFRWVPMKLISHLTNKTCYDTPEVNRTSVSGIVSTLDGMDNYYCDQFTAKSAFAVPIPVHTVNFFFSLWECEDCIDIALGMPNVMATNGRLDKCFMQVVDALTARGSDNPQ